MPNPLYYLIEDLGMTAEQRGIVFELCEDSGEGRFGPYPHLDTQIRYRLDGNACLYEGDFNDLNIGTFISRLAQAGVGSENNLRAQPQATNYGQEWVFQARSGDPPVWADAMRWIVFGGVSAGYGESRDLAAQYIVDNLAEWESEA